MGATDIETDRERAVGHLTAAYVRDRISMEQLEARLASVASATGRPELAALIADLGDPGALTPAVPDPDFPEALQRLSGSVRRAGFWLRSRRVRLECIGSSVRLDMTQIEGHGGEPFVLDLSAKGSSVRIRVPPGTRVEDELANYGGTVRIRRKVLRSQTADGPRVVLRGKSWGSSIVVAPTRGRGRDR